MPAEEPAKVGGKIEVVQRAGGKIIPMGSVGGKVQKK